MSALVLPASLQAVYAHASSRFRCDHVGRGVTISDGVGVT